jgi:hypothetical protein
MSNQRTHYVTTSDGVTIGATVHGQGPPWCSCKAPWAMGTSTGRRCCRT